MEVAHRKGAVASVERRSELRFLAIHFAAFAVRISEQNPQARILFCVLLGFDGESFHLRERAPPARSDVGLVLGSDSKALGSDRRCGVESGSFRLVSSEPRP